MQFQTSCVSGLRGSVKPVALLLVLVGCLTITASASAAVSRFSAGLASPALESQAPVVLEVIPAGDKVQGGKVIKIEGANFEGATEVTFGGSEAIFEVVSSEDIRAVAPPGPAPTVDIRVTTPEGISAITPADEFFYQSKSIQISEVAPHQGPAAGDTSVAISGEEFYGVTGVKFGTADALSFTVHSGESITAVAPPNTAEKIAIQVESTFGPSSPKYCGPLRNRKCSVRDYYKYLEPTVTEVTPNSGPASGGTSVTLTGTGFGLGTGETEFKIGKALATSVECSSITTCTAVTPPAKKRKGGAADVVVTVNSNEPASSTKNPAVAFLYE